MRFLAVLIEFTGRCVLVAMVALLWSTWSPRPFEEVADGLLAAAALWVAVQCRQVLRKREEKS